jgi:hypothetical protein
MSVTLPGPVTVADRGVWQAGAPPARSGSCGGVIADVCPPRLFVSVFGMHRIDLFLAVTEVRAEGATISRTRFPARKTRENNVLTSG